MPLNGTNRGSIKRNRPFILPPLPACWINHEAAAGIAQAMDLIDRREAVVLEAARADDFDIDKLKQAMAEQSEIL